MKRVSVSVQNDYLERMSKTRPINAVAELVWNSLDADADKIRVKLFENEMGGLEKLTVTDNGHGLDYSLAERAFGSLGGSWKKQERKTRGKKRFLHGRQGKGRFSAFALGQSVEWKGDHEGIVDLMLSKLVPMPRGEQREHLVIELKRPTQKINSDIAQQIKSYAMAVVGDERFKSTHTRWVFWAISNDLTKEVQEDVSQANRPEGILYQSKGGDVTVWVKTWAEVLQDCEGRMNFYKKQLEYTATRASGLEHLKATYEKYLPDVLKPKQSGNSSPS